MLRIGAANIRLPPSANAGLNRSGSKRCTTLSSPCFFEPLVHLVTQGYDTRRKFGVFSQDSIRSTAMARNITSWVPTALTS